MFVLRSFRWFTILLRTLQYMTDHTPSVSKGAPGLYDVVQAELRAFQTVAILEVRTARSHPWLTAILLIVVGGTLHAGRGQDQPVHHSAAGLLTVVHCMGCCGGCPSGRSWAHLFGDSLRTVNMCSVCRYVNALASAWCYWPGPSLRSSATPTTLSPYWAVSHT